MSLFKPNILIIERQIQTAETIQEITDTLKYKSRIEIKSANALLHLANNQNINLILLDVNMPKINGENMQDKINNLYPQIGIITLTTYNDLQKAILSIKSGAFNYLQKPINKQKLSLAIMSYIASNNLPSITKINYFNHITNETRFKDIYHDIHVLNYKKEPITVLGEPGSGKKLLAKIIHSTSIRKVGPLLCVNLATQSNDIFDKKLIESKSGSLIILGIEHLSIQQQTKLFQKVHLKNKGDQPYIIFCINTNNNKETKALYENILKNKISVPPLRERKIDLRLLAQYFLIKYTSQYERYISTIHPEALEIIRGYDYPKNVSELDEIISSAVLLERSHELCASSLPYHMKNYKKIEDTFVDVKFKAILKVLDATKGNRTQAAKRLGMARSSLNKLLKECFDDNH